MEKNEVIEAQQLAGRLYGDLVSTAEEKTTASMALLKRVADVLNGMEQASEGRARFKAQLSPDGRKLVVQLVPGDDVVGVRLATKINGHLSVSSSDEMSERKPLPLAFNAFTGAWEGVEEDLDVLLAPGERVRRRSALAVVVEEIGAVIRAEREGRDEAHRQEVEGQRRKAAQRVDRAEVHSRGALPRLKV